MSLNNYLDPFYDEYPQIEGAFQTQLDKSPVCASTQVHFGFIEGSFRFATVGVSEAR